MKLEYCSQLTATTTIWRKQNSRLEFLQNWRSKEIEKLKSFTNIEEDENQKNKITKDAQDMEQCQ